MKLWNVKPGDECPTCGGSGQRATARSANARELERHERNGTPCDDCGGTGANNATRESANRNARLNAIQAGSWGDA